MDRARQALLVALLLTASGPLLNGCAQDLPLDVWLDTAFDQEEAAAINRAIEGWNGVCLERLAEPTRCLNVVGRIREQFRPEAFSDDRHVIYKLATDSEWPRDPLDEDTAGYGTRADVLIKTHTFADFAFPITWSKAVIRHEYLVWLEHLALHELGHLLGMMHFDHRPGVMNKWDDSGYDERLTEADIDQFCLVYECRPPPEKP